MKLPVVALVGCSNVGKSTLFNRLVGERKALVSNVKNLTRDRNYHTLEWDNCKLVLVDTGGVDGKVTDNDFGALIVRQVDIVLQEAAVILLVVDGKKGLTIGDEIFIEKIRRLDKPVLLVVNKIDFNDPDLIISDFIGLGYPVYAVSAEHNVGISNLKEAILEFLPKVAVFQEEKDLKIAVIGKPNAGKSTLINHLIGENRLITSNIAGTTRDYIEVPLVYQNKRYCFIDTAGVKKRYKIDSQIEQLAFLKVNQLLEEVEIVLLLVDAVVGITEQDVSIAGEVWKQGKLILVVFNKEELLSIEQKKKLIEQLTERISFVPLITYLWVSAVKGVGIKNMFKKIDELYKKAYQKFKTNQLNQVLIRAMLHHHPPLVKGRPVKIRYVHFGHYNPLTFILHGSRVKKLPDSYLRYLEHCFRANFGLSSIPIRLIFDEK